MNKIITDEEFEIVDQKTVLIKLKLDIYDLQETEFLGSIVGGIINGNANIDADSDIRRTFSLTVVPDRKSKVFVDKQQYIWIDKIVRVSIGIVNERTQEVHWWKFGKFVFTSTNTTYDATTNQLTINCSDLMSTLDGSKNGELGQLSIVYPAYKEFTEDAEDIFYSEEMTYSNNIYTLKLDNYNVYGLSDYIVTTIPANNQNNPLFRINSLYPIPIVDKDQRRPIKANTLIAGKFYAFFVDNDKLVLCSEGALDDEASKDYTATSKATYTCSTMESIPHYSFQGISEPRVGDVFFMRSDLLSAAGDDYVLPRIPMVEFDSGNRYPILYHMYNVSQHSDNFYTAPHLSSFPDGVPFIPYMPDTGYKFDKQGYLRGQKWSIYWRTEAKSSEYRGGIYDPLLSVTTGAGVYNSLLKTKTREETEGEHKNTKKGEKLKITFIDDYSWEAEWTRKIKINGKKKTVVQKDSRTSEIYSVDADYIRQFSKVILINLPGYDEDRHKWVYKVYGWTYDQDDPGRNNPNYIETANAYNTITSKNEYGVTVSTTRPIMANDSVTCVIDKKFTTYDEWYQAGIPFKNDPLDPRNPFSDYWYSGVGGIPQSFPYGTKQLEQPDFYVSSTKKAPLQLVVNGRYRFNIVDDKYNPISEDVIKEGENTYSFMISKNGQYAQIVPELYERPLIPYGTPLNYYTIRNAILTTVGQLAHIKRNTCEVDDVGEYRGMPQYNPDYEEYRKKYPLWDNIPYDLEFAHGDTVLAILQKMRDLYPNYECYFDENGTFCTNMIPSGNQDEIIIPEKYFTDNLISENTNMDLTTVRNVCHAWGQVLDADYYCDNGVYYDGNDSSKYVDLYDLYDNVDYTKIQIETFDAGTNIYVFSTTDSKIEDYFNDNAYETEPFYCLYGYIDKISDGTPKYVRYHYTYNTDGSIKEITEEWYNPNEGKQPKPEYNVMPSFQLAQYFPNHETDEHKTDWLVSPRMMVKKIAGTLKEKQYYEMQTFKTDWTILYNTTASSSSSISGGSGSFSPVYPYREYGVTEMTPIRFYDSSNCINAEIPAYDQYMTGDIIAIKMADNFVETYDSILLNINNLGTIPVYDENTYKPLQKGIIKPSETYCFKIKKIREAGEDVVAAYLLGSWQVQGIAALVDRPYGDENQPYTTTGGVTVNKYSKEYFQEIYACPSVELVVDPDSPFTCQAIGEVMSVYIDETNLTSDALAVSRAEYELYLKARLTDSISITTKLAPFADVNLKVGYRRQDNGIFEHYVIKSISHDLSGGTTTWQLMHFYPLYKDDSNIGIEWNVTLERDEKDYINNVIGGGTYKPGATVTLIAEPKDGYHLEGWEVIKGGVTIEDNQFTMPSRNVEIRAIGAPNVVNITYDGNGGTPNPKGEQIPYGVKISLNDGTTMEHPDEADFLGWSEDSTDIYPLWPVNEISSTAFGYADDYSINFQTLYAIWKDDIGLFYTGTDDLKIGWSTLLSTNKIILDNGYIIPGEEHTLSEGRFSTEDLTGDLRISKKVISIDDYAFYVGPYHGDNVYRGKYLTGVKIPSSITTIGSFAFCNDTNLATLDLSEADNLTLISNYAFANSGIKHLSLNGNNLNLSLHAFEGCNDLETIKGLEYVNAIGQEAFSHCNSLTEITIPSSVNELYPDAFAFCDNLSSFIIEEGDTRLQTGYASLLREDEELSYVQIPDSLRQPVEGDEYGEIPIFRTGDQVNDHYPLLKTAGPIGGGYNIEYGYIEVIPEALFEDLHYLEEATVPDTITEIRDCAFKNCKRLLSINYDSNISDWNDIIKYSDSFLNVNPLCRVYCTDGDIPLFN